MKITIEKADDSRLSELGVDSWSPWECEPSVFDWKYDSEEIAYIKEGHVIVTTDFEEVQIRGGDIVVFPAGLKCKWDVRETIRKVYSFR